MLIAMTWAVATVPAVAQQVIQAGSYAELREKFCNADPRKELVVVLPARLFADSEQVICESGPYKLYRIVSVYDTDDFEYWLDPPFYERGTRLGCDGKAGRNMQTVALNCRPL